MNIFLGGTEKETKLWVTGIGNKEQEEQVGICPHVGVSHLFARMRFPILIECSGNRVPWLVPVRCHFFLHRPIYGGR